jgi:hypothetical protein
MTSRAYFVRAPRIAAWLVNLFAPAEEAELILGDLLEEFLQVASRSGVSVARSWYWRQTLKTVAHLTGPGLLVAPWWTAATVVGGFFLQRFASGLPEKAIFAVLIRYRVFDHHFNAYLFFASTGIQIGRVISSMLVGCIVASAAKRREVATTMMLDLVLCSMAAAALFILVSRGQYFFLWTLPWHCAEWLAIAIGGAIVRTLRSRTIPLPS